MSTAPVTFSLVAKAAALVKLSLLGKAAALVLASCTAALGIKGVAAAACWRCGSDAFGANGNGETASCAASLEKGAALVL